jgi:hypothetical protein
MIITIERLRAGRVAMESDIENVRGKLSGLAGTPLSEQDIVALLAEVISGGGGVVIEIDDARYKLLRRDGRFVLIKDTRGRMSSVPPRR